ncbi:MAG: hypothetical protein AB2L24_16825 [Mangrovibacterium sp.]
MSAKDIAKTLNIRKHWNGPNHVVLTLSADSYVAYIIHPVVVVTVNHLVRITGCRAVIETGLRAGDQYPAEFWNSSPLAEDTWI